MYVEELRSVVVAAAEAAAVKRTAVEGDLGESQTGAAVLR